MPLGTRMYSILLKSLSLLNHHNRKRAMAKCPSERKRDKKERGAGEHIYVHMLLKSDKLL